MANDRGPLIATFDDGTQIYRNGVLNSRGYFEVNVGIFNFGAEFNPNTGEWTGNETATFVTTIGNGSVEIAPSGDGISVEVGTSIGIVDVGVVITENGDVLPMFGLGVGNDILGASVGFVIADDGSNLSSYNTITVSSNGTVIKTENFPGDADHPNVKVEFTIYDSQGNIISQGTTNIGDSQLAADMAAGIAPRVNPQCFGPEVPIDMWPLDPEFAPNPNNSHEQYDQEAVRAKIWKKPIEQIRVGDYVVSHDKNGNMVPGYVPRTMTNNAKILLNFHGTRVTPGHVYYRPDSKKTDKFETLIDILRDDGVIKHQDGTLIRAASDIPVGDPRDGFVKAITGTRRSDGGVDANDQGRIRLGTRFIVGEGKDRKSFAVADLVKAGGGVVGDDELIRVGDSEPMPFHWDFGVTLPKPEDFVLACSGTTLEDIYKAAEWESQGPRLPAPMVLDGGHVKPLKGAALSALPRNKPLDVTHTTMAAQKP